MKLLPTFIIVMLFLGCNKNNEITTGPDPHTNTPNILLIIADDIGKDAINGFSKGAIKPLTPNIDVLRNNGLSFTNFWVYPTCSPTRSSVITGKYGYRTGVKWAGDQLNANETILQKYIRDETNNAYTSALVGKWHLSGSDTGVNPESFGIDYYAGILRGDVDNYYNWQLSEDEISTNQREYTTTKFTDLAINWIQQQNKPWFMWLAYNAPHIPFHVPPTEMHNQGNLPTYSNGLDLMPYYIAAIEAMDFQIGRLLENISDDERENTIIIFIGDNGTPVQVVQSPYSRFTAKGTLFQGGINSPMFISGKGVTRKGIDHNLITGTDLFATIAGIAGVPVQEIHDSKSFTTLFTSETPMREFQYSEMDNGNINSWTISNGQFKLIIDANGNDQMFNLENDPYEETDILGGVLSSEEINARTELESELITIRN